MTGYGKHPQDQTDQVGAVRDLWEKAREARRSVNSVIREERDFMYRLSQYKDERVAEHDETQIQPRGRQTHSKHRHKLAEIAKAPIFLDPRPMDPGATPEDGELAKAVMEFEINDPERQYRRKERAMISSALASRMGAMGLEVSYRHGKPKVFPYLIDPLRLYWDPDFVDPDDPECPWVIHERYPTLAWIRSMKAQGWKNVDRIKPDDGMGPAPDASTRNRADESMSSQASGGQPVVGPVNLDDRATILVCWYRFDESRMKRDRLGPDGQPIRKDLPESKRYLACGADGCGHRDYSLPGEVIKPGGNYGDCPMCGGPLGGVVREVQTEDVLAYPDGRLVIAAPYSRVEAYDDKWPWKIRNIPIFTYPCYVDPYEQFAICDTTLDWDEQMVLNATSRRMYHQAMRPATVIIVKDGLERPDSPEPFEFTNDPIALAKWTGLGPVQDSVWAFNAQTVNPALAGIHAMTEQSLRADAGTADFNLTGQQLKGTQVGTIEQATATGEIPVRAHIEILQERRSGVFGVWFDMWRDINDERVVVPIPTTGAGNEWKEVRGSELKSFHFMMANPPDWAPDTEQRMKAVQILMGTQPEYREVVAEAGGLSPSILRKLATIDKQMAEAEAEAQSQAAMNGNAIPPQGEPPVPAGVQSGGMQPTMNGG